MNNACEMKITLNKNGDPRKVRVAKNKLTPEEVIIHNREKTKKYYEKNQEKIREKKKNDSAIFYKDNKELCKERMKITYQKKKNKEVSV